MKTAILIDPATQSVTEITIDELEQASIDTLIGEGIIDSSVIRPNEVILYHIGATGYGFRLPTTQGNVCGNTRALIVGSVGSNVVDSKFTAAYIRNNIHWTKEGRIILHEAG